MLPHAAGAAALLFGCLTGGLLGCLSPNGGETGTSDVMLGTDTGTTGDATSDASTTHPVIMTTTEEPETTDAPGSESSDTSNGTTDPQDTTTSVDPKGCGNGSIEPGEECDAGADNSDVGLCTSTCHSAKCGDGYVQPGEACDDTVNDGSYGGCAVDCTALAAYCGDGVVDDGDEIEACDGGDPWDASGGCLQNCQFAASCLKLREGFPDDDTLVDGVYTIKPGNKPMVSVYCDMDADGGGYTFLKVSLPGVTHRAVEAESQCAQYGMKLLAPRTPSHVVAATIAAKSTLLDPVGGGTVKDDIKYLSILGIYPVTPGKSCVDKPLNSMDCPEWKAKTGPYFVTATVTDGQPGTSNCAGCSMYYIWSDSGKLESYEAFTAGGSGAVSDLYMCDTADKHGA